MKNLTKILATFSLLTAASVFSGISAGTTTTQPQQTAKPTPTKVISPLLAAFMAQVKKSAKQVESGVKVIASKTTNHVKTGISKTATKTTHVLETAVASSKSLAQRIKDAIRNLKNRITKKITN